MLIRGSRPPAIRLIPLLVSVVVSELFGFREYRFDNNS